MAYKSVLNNNRIFKDPGNVIISSFLTAQISIIGTVSTINLNDSSDFSQSGYVSIGSEIFYYSGKELGTHTLIGVTRAVKGTTATQHSIDDPVIQNRPTPSGISNTDSNLAGWYVDGKTNQASLRVLDSPVIQQGVIRFNNELGVFQGCTATSPEIVWQEFNAIQGPPGDPGIINAILTFENVDDPVTLTSNIGEIIKTTTINTLDDPIPPIEVRTIVSGNVSINGLKTDVLAITQTDNEIICTPQPTPLTWNMQNDSVSDLKGWDATNQQAYTWGSTVKLPVTAGNIPVAGQLVVSYIAPGNQLCVKPLSFTNATTDLNPLKVSPTYPPDLGIVGICINNPTVDTPAVVATSGIAQVKLSTTTNYATVSADLVIQYTGKLCIANGSGFGINVTSAIVPPYVQIGRFLESGNMTTSGNALVYLDPKIITPT